MLVDIVEVFSEISALTGFITFAVTILGAVSLFLANMGRYFQAKKFGIPAKAVHQANISDSADLWIALAGALGLGFFVPIAMLSLDMAWWQLFTMAFLTFKLGLLSTKSTFSIRTKRLKKRAEHEYYVFKDISLLILLVIALAAAFAYVRLHGVYNDIFVSETGSPDGFFANFRLGIAIFICGFNSILLLSLLCSHVYGRMFGNDEVMTTVVEGETYLIAMRHNQYQWVLIRCDFEEYVVEKRKIDFPVKKILFIKGVFIMRDLSTLDEPITHHKGFSVAERGNRVQ